MSASEKLRALDAEMRVFDAGLTELKVLEALPLIADVVEAAEALISADRFGLVAEDATRVRSSLTALREHLEGQ